VTIGWYVHHHGAGHAQRFAAVAPHLDNVVALTSAPVPRAVALDLDTTDDPREPTAGGALHWAPLGHPGLRSRMGAISRWIVEHEPAAFVVDVSVEVAALARLHGVPTVVVAQRGQRHDSPHRFAYASASAVAAPWTSATHLPGDGPPRDRVRFTGAISRFDARVAASPSGNTVLVLVGSGGHALTAADVEAAAAATRDWDWHVAGALRVDAELVTDHGPDADVWALLERAAVVVGTAGGNVVAEVAAARRPYVCLPQQRPFDEQHRHADALARADLADVHRAWPDPHAWDEILAAARERDPARWEVLHDGGGAQRMAALVQEVAAA
jgi:UDP-N-acetylglucosamine:LPS N-acetylglucosamine transferase